MSVRDRARCPECGRVLAVQPPAGGDGSADVFPRHYAMKVALAPGGSRGVPCDYGRQVVRHDEYVPHGPERASHGS